MDLLWRLFLSPEVFAHFLPYGDLVCSNAPLIRHKQDWRPQDDFLGPLMPFSTPEDDVADPWGSFSQSF